ncbi:hypothetical protein SAMN05444716_1212 [Streptomyces harbinensis]|uniref:Uncharacterized protein n=1 Tax=Streptomyces harbinensis TaxID=1176198 RepID=A0A1I6WCW4_9ACTN|nr:hypothetical protein SAMN05444716_1212 [Streptomyces harbinensis]
MACGRLRRARILSSVWEGSASETISFRWQPLCRGPCRIRFCGHILVDCVGHRTGSSLAPRPVPRGLRMLQRCQNTELGPDAHHGRPGLRLHRDAVQPVLRHTVDPGHLNVDELQRSPLPERDHDSSARWAGRPRSDVPGLRCSQCRSHGSVGPHGVHAQHPVVRYRSHRHRAAIRLPGRRAGSGDLWLTPRGRFPGDGAVDPPVRGIHRPVEKYAGLRRQAADRCEEMGELVQTTHPFVAAGERLQAEVAVLRAAEAEPDRLLSERIVRCSCGVADRRRCPTAGARGVYPVVVGGLAGAADPPHLGPGRRLSYEGAHRPCTRPAGSAPTCSTRCAR